MNLKPRTFLSATVPVLLAIAIGIWGVLLAPVALHRLPVLGGIETASAAPEASPIPAEFSEYVSIPRIGVSTVVVNTPRVGNTWETSHLTSQVGHMEGTALPGQGGNVVLVAHRYLGINNAQLTNPGPFAGIDRLQAGDAIVVQTASNVFTYHVSELFQITRRDAWVLNPVGSEVVTLMSCDGFNAATQTFDKLLVVRATLTSVEPRTVEAAAGAPAGSSAGTVKTNLRVRTGPSTRYQIAQIAAGGSSVNIVGRNANGTWLKVEYNGSQGWVYGWYVQTSADVNSLPIVDG